MKNLIIFSVIGLLLLGCKEEPKRTDYIINVNAKNVYNGVRSYLKAINQNGKERVIDTAIVINEKFSFTGKVETPALHVITVNGVKGNLNFMLENSIIDIDVDKTDISKSKVSGSASQIDHEIYQKGMFAAINETKRLRLQLRNRDFYNKKIKSDSITKLYKTSEKKLQEFPLEFVNVNTGSYYSLHVIDQEMRKKNSNLEALTAAFENLNAEIKTSIKGLKIKNDLDNLLAISKKNKQLKIGKVAPNFEGSTDKGNKVSLNDIKGKVTIIDFWAAWCAPCRRENPNVVKVYNQYHDQGLEIISISLDGSRTQKNPKQAWIDAIEKDNLTWTHVSSLQYFNDPIAQLYNITSIPATYILDKDGIIVAKNLRGKALELKIKELIQN
jgi:peroxiredoxin